MDEKQIKLENYRRLNRFAKKGQILFVGSSLMEQFPVHELFMDFDLPLKVYNRGIGGYTTSELIDAMEVCVFDLAPRVICINIGTNDMNGEDYSLGGLIERYAFILKSIRARLPKTRVFALSYFPVNDSVADANMRRILAFRTNDRIREANEAVKGLAESLGIAYIDVNEGITDDAGRMKSEFTIEGMHMFADGYQEVLKALIRQIDFASISE